MNLNSPKASFLLYSIIFHKNSSQEWDYVINNESDFYYGAGDKLGVFVSEKAKSFMESLCLPLKYNEL